MFIPEIVVFCTSANILVLIYSHRKEPLECLSYERLRATLSAHLSPAARGKLPAKTRSSALLTSPPQVIHAI